MCPQEFKSTARAVLPAVQGTAGPADEDLRKALLKFVADFANWDFASNRGYMDVGRKLVQAAHGNEHPLVVDPFAGGGSIPLEALRLGCETFASDLNPVACLILKVMLEDIPHCGSELATQMRRVGAEVRRAAERELSELYPMDSDGAKPIAYIWARTVRCEAPRCGAEIPLARSFWLSTKARRRRALRHRVVRTSSGPPKVEFEIFEPKAEKDVPSGTVRRATATCVACGSALAPERVRAQLAEQRGGADVIFDAHGWRIGGARMLAVVTLHSEKAGRQYRDPEERDYAAVNKAQQRLAKIMAAWERSGRQGPCPVPDEPTPAGGGSGAGRAFSVQRYGMVQWADVFTARQKVALAALAVATAAVGPLKSDAPMLALGKLTDLGNALCSWMPGQECPSAVFKLGRVKMGWDFAEGCVLGESSGSYEKCTENLVAGVLATYLGDSRTGQAMQAMAQDSPLPDDSAAVWFTDPPYYDAIPYADLADVFLVWLKRIAPHHPLLRDPFDPNNSLSPKNQEAVQDETRLVDGRPKDASFFNKVMSESFSEGARVLRDDGIGGVVFAHKTTEGWEALLSGMIRGGWTITASWPIATEMGHRLRARDSAALATSVHLVCRPRRGDAKVGDWEDVLRELPKRVGDWMERLQSEGVRGADLVFACIGPALEIFSRYRRVETADEREVALDEYLEKVWEVVGRTALENVLGTAEARARNGLAGALEEDARLTALFLWTLESTKGTDVEEDEDTEADDEEAGPADEEDEEGPRPVKGYALVHDVVRRFAQPLGIELSKWEGSIIETKKGVVRLLPVNERAAQLFGAEGAQAVAARLEDESTRGASSLQGLLFPENEEAPRVRGRTRGRRPRAAEKDPDEVQAVALEATTLDRVHAAMLLQSAGRANALRALLKAEQERSPDFLRLANALSALYPKGSEEKRLLDAMLLATPR